MPIRIAISQILEYSKNYTDDDNVIIAIQEKFKRSRVLSLDDLYIICKWKSPRSAGQARNNSEIEVKADEGTGLVS